MKRILAVGALFTLIMTGIAAQEDEPLVITVLEFVTEEVSENEMKTIVDRLSSSLFQAWTTKLPPAVSLAITLAFHKLRSH